MPYARLSAPWLTRLVAASIKVKSFFIITLYQFVPLGVMESAGRGIVTLSDSGDGAKLE